MYLCDETKKSGMGNDIKLSFLDGKSLFAHEQ